jgi:hypothetical protein
MLNSLKVKQLQEKYPHAEIQVWFFDEELSFKNICRRS